MYLLTTATCRSMLPHDILAGFVESDFIRATRRTVAAGCVISFNYDFIRNLAGVFVHFQTAHIKTLLNDQNDFYNFFASVDW